MELKIFYFNGGFLRKKRFLHDNKNLCPFTFFYPNQPCLLLERTQNTFAELREVDIVDLTQIVSLTCCVSL